MAQPFLDFLITIISFIVLIGILVFIHEFGHFIVARLCGVGVNVFSLGFGPKLIKKVYGRTEYCVSAIPLGGYVKMVGEDPSAEIDSSELAISFTHKPLWKKALVVAAGPGFNFFLTVLIFYVMYFAMGAYLSKPIVDKVMENTPAAEQGIQPGDIIREINKAPIEIFEDIPAQIKKSGDKPIEIVLERDGTFISVSLTPVMRPAKNVFGENIQKPVIGIVGGSEQIHKSLNAFEAFSYATQSTYDVVKGTVLSVFKMITGSISAKDNLGGPIMIAKIAGQRAKIGVVAFVELIAVLSVSLGIINLLPIPVLDGGHLLFYSIEAVTRKPVGEKLRENMIKFGVAVLVTLIVFVIYNDIRNMITINGG